MTKIIPLLILLGGCAHAPASQVLFEEPFPRVEIPDVEIPANNDEWCKETRPVGPGSELACVGMLVPPNELEALLDESDLLVQAKRALSVSYDGRQSDREGAEEILEAQEYQTKAAHNAQPKMVLLGAGIGSVSVLAVMIAILLTRP